MDVVGFFVVFVGLVCYINDGDDGVFFFLCGICCYYIVYGMCKLLVFDEVYFVVVCVREVVFGIGYDGDVVCGLICECCIDDL